MHAKPLTIMLAARMLPLEASGRTTRISAQLVAAAKELRQAVSRLRFGAPVAHFYNPLDYAWLAHEFYLRKYGRTRKRVMFLGMNPGPFGMVQTGVPFGEVGAVRDWLRIRAEIKRPAREHPKRRIEGFDCTRSEISGARLWGLMQDRFATPERFFADQFVANYCPLAFLEASGRNLTPDHLPIRQARVLYHLCDEHLSAVAAALQPEWIIGVGAFAAERSRIVFADSAVRIGQILHPSPASPAANRDWAAQATAQLIKLGVWNGAV